MILPVTPSHTLHAMPLATFEVKRQVSFNSNDTRLRTENQGVRILALDGGGVRGLSSLMVLER